MCGRFAFFHEVEPLARELGAVDLTDAASRARWNIPPTASIVVVTESRENPQGPSLRALRMARWGLLPPFAHEESFSSKTFNARRESLADKPSFRGSLGRYRAVIPMSGYYEWKRTADKPPQPHFIATPGGDPLLVAALVSWWKGHGSHEGPGASDDGRWLLTATVITRESDGLLADIHHRMPAILSPASVNAWLNQDMDDRHEAQSWISNDAHLLSSSDLRCHPVDRAVGSVRREGPDLITPIEPG